MLEEDLEILKSAGLLLWEEEHEAGELKKRILLYPRKEVNEKDA